MRSRQCLWFLIILAYAFVAKAESPKVIKIWDFSLPHGSLRVYLRSFPDGTSGLGIGPSGHMRVAPIVEQVPALKQVLAEMKKLGVDPRTLAYLGTRLFNKDVIQKLAYACVDSRNWKLSMKHSGKGKENLVVALLNTSGAFEPYNDAFKQYGILMRVTEAEKVGLMHFSNVVPRNSRDRSNANVWVPADAIVGMRFSKAN